MTNQSLESYLKQLNPDQQTAVHHGEGPAMVLAGAGSGKTRVLTTRAAWLLAGGLRPDEVMLVTFTNKAAGEMRQRIQDMTGLLLPWSGTFHSLCARILRRHGRAINLPEGYSIYDSGDQLSLLKQVMKDKGWSTKELKPKSVLYKISDAKNEMLTPSDSLNQAQSRFEKQVAQIYIQYQAALTENNAVDFDDLLLKTIELFETSPVIEQYQTQLKHVLVDEYQDTNKAQYHLTKMLTAPQDNLYVVGDFSQSIYAWRGADYRNMMALKTEFDQIAEYRLEQNYRSTQTILSTATQVVSQNSKHPILSLWTDREPGTNYEKVTLHETIDQNHEAETVVKYIRQMLTEYRYSDMAILYRTNAQSRAFEEAFVKAGIPYQVVGGTKFYERKEIKDVLSYLKLLVNREDTVSYTRAEKIGKRRLQSMLTALADVLDDPTNLATQEPGPLIEKILTATTYKQKYDAKDPDDASRLENIDELIHVAHQFETVLQFLENVALVQNDELVDVVEQEPHNQVTLMSLHGAKGLEFPVVFMVGMEEGLLPHSRSLLNEDEMEEERRLCYVGITRAKDALFFTYTRRRDTYRGASYATRSRFLSDISASLVNVVQSSPAQSYQFNQSKYQKKSSLNTKSGRRYVPIDDSTLDGVISGDLDIEAFLDV